MVRTQRIPDTPCPMPRWSIKSSGCGLWSQNHQQFLGWWWIILGYAGGDGWHPVWIFWRETPTGWRISKFPRWLGSCKVLKLNRIHSTLCEISVPQKSQGGPEFWGIQPSGAPVFLGNKIPTAKGGHWTCATCGGHVYRSCRERGRWVDAVGCGVVVLLGWRFGGILPKWLKLVEVGEIWWNSSCITIVVYWCIKQMLISSMVLFSSSLGDFLRMKPATLHTDFFCMHDCRNHVWLGGRFSFVKLRYHPTLSPLSLLVSHGHLLLYIFCSSSAYPQRII